MGDVKKETVSLVPQTMRMDGNAAKAINFMLGSADADDDTPADAILWVGNLEGDDGAPVHGLHLANAEYPEEGSITLVEFPALRQPDTHMEGGGEPVGSIYGEFTPISINTSSPNPEHVEGDVVSVGELVEALHHRIDEYWRIAWREGSTGRVHDNEDNDASRVRSEIDTIITTLAASRLPQAGVHAPPDVDNRPFCDCHQEYGEGLIEALEWYAEQARLCRLIHSGGDAGRTALAADGGKRAKAALSTKTTGEPK